MKFSSTTNHKAMSDYIKPIKTIDLKIAYAQIKMARNDKLYIEGHSEIDDDAAELISKYQGLIYLYDLTKLSDAAAKSLSKHQGKIYLDSEIELSDAALESLSNKNGTICDKKPANWAADWRSINYMIDAEDINNKSCNHKWFKGTPSGIISLKLAQKFLSDKKSVRLDKYVEINNEAAELLSNYRGFLPLSNIIKLSDEAAESLSKHEGELLLGSLTELSDAGLESLSKHKGTLYFIYLRISEKGAESLSRHKGKLYLGGWDHTSDAAFESLSKHRGSLTFLFLYDLSDAAAKSLSKHQGILGLTRLNVLSWQAATYLAAKNGSIENNDPEWIYNQVEELLDADAESISKHQGNLDLFGLIEMSVVSAEALSRKKGTICGKTPAEWVDAFQNEQRSKTIDLKSVQSRLEMAKVSGIADFSSDEKYFIDDDAAEALSKHKGDLTLKLHRLSDACAESLSKHQGELCITWLTRMSDAAAKSLSKHQGDLLLSFVHSGRKKMSDTAIESLSKHKGDIHFVGLNQQLSESAAKALSRKKGTICGKAPAEWVASLQS